MKKIVSTLFMAAVATACSVSDTIKTSNTVNVPTTDNTLAGSTVVQLNKVDIMFATGLTKQGSTITLGRRGNDYQAVTIDLQNGSRKELLPAGQRKNALGTYALSGRDGRVGTFNIRTGQLTETRGHVATRSGGEEVDVIQLPKKKQHFRAVRAGEYVLSTGLYKEGRYLLYNPETGEESYQLSYPAHTSFPGIRETTKAIMYASSILKVRPDNQAFVCADMYSGMIEFCRLSGERIERIQELCFHQPKVIVNEKARAKVSYLPDNRFGFTDVTVSGNKVYAIYSGKTYSEDKYNFQECRKLFVFDWEGNILESHNLDTPLTYVSFDETENAIYGLAKTPQPAVVKFSL